MQIKVKFLYAQLNTEYVNKAAAMKFAWTTCNNLMELKISFETIFRCKNGK